MTVEFYSSDNAVSETVIAYIRDEIMKLHKQYHTISRADISFKQKKRQTGSEKICEISLFIAGNSVNAKGICKGFDHASKKAIALLNDNVKASFRQKVHDL